MREPVDWVHACRSVRMESHLSDHRTRGELSIAESSGWFRYMPNICGWTCFCREASHITCKERSPRVWWTCVVCPIHSMVSHIVCMEKKMSVVQPYIYLQRAVGL